jgi:hypothetical protein
MPTRKNGKCIAPDTHCQVAESGEDLQGSVAVTR